MIHNSANGAILVTTAGISEPARKFADGKGIELVDGDALLSFLREADLSEDLLPDDLVSLGRSAWPQRLADSPCV